MGDSKLERPRLSARISARRHISDGEGRILLLERWTQRFIVVGEREWAMLCCADGARDLRGIQITAAQRGRQVDIDELAAFFAQLDRLGFLADDDESEHDDDAPVLTEAALEAKREAIADRPIDPFPDYRLSCDGRGACCSTFGTVLFSRQEALRALALLADSGSPASETRDLFTPERGASFELWGPAHGALAVTLHHGRCAFLDEGDRCTLHRLGGPAWKPAGCQLYPLRFIDDGEAIRATPVPECACVFSSFRGKGGEPLLPKRDMVGADLPRAAHVGKLPPSIAISERNERPREEVIAWSREVLDALRDDPDPDLAATLLRTSHEMESGALTPWLGELDHPLWWRDALTPELRTLGERARRWVELSSSWCAPDARALRGTRACLEGCAELLAADRPPGATNIERRDESLYGLTLFHGYLWLEPRPLSKALRRRALRLLLARTEALRESFGDDEHPLGVVESVLRNLETT